MKTQILIRYKPVRAVTLAPLDVELWSGDPLSDPISADNNWAYRSKDNANYPNDNAFLKNVRPQSDMVSLDLYDDTSIPLNYRIMDVREPEKRKTNFSKTITIPGTKGNNRIFNHIYEISGVSKFNPNLRTEVVILHEGVQVMRGNMQLKEILPTEWGGVEYEVIISGDLTSLFADMGVSKISDLDFSEWNHIWDRSSVENSWDNLVRNTNGSIQFPGYPYRLERTVDQGPARYFTSIGRQQSTGRIMITTTSPHGLTADDWVRVEPDRLDPLRWPLVNGDWSVSEIINGTTFTINHPFPDGMMGNTQSGYIQRWNPTGRGYVYPMISWGDDSIVGGKPRFPTTSFSIAFYVKEIWDKIFQKTGSKYQSDFLNSNFFKRLIITQKRTNYELPPDELKERVFKVANDIQWEVSVAGFGTQSSGSLSGSLRTFPYNGTNLNRPYPFTASIPASNGVLSNGFGDVRPFDQGTGIWRVTDNGVYSLNFSITMDLSMYVTNFVRQVGSNTWNNVTPANPGTQPQWKRYYGGWPSNAYDEGVGVVALLQLSSNGTTTTIGQSIHQFKNDANNQIIQDTFRDWRFAPRSLSLGFSDRYLKKDDELWVEIRWQGDFNNDVNGLFTEVENWGNNPNGPNPPKWYARRGLWKLRSLGVQVLQVNPTPTIVENSEVFVNQFLPKDLLCKDFVLGIIRMFNLHIEPDPDVEKLYRIEPRDNYYRDGSGGLQDYVDWTDKVDAGERGSKIKRTPMGELTAKFYKFEWKSDSDYWNKKYKDDTGKGWGDFTKEVQNDFLNNEVKITLPFGSSPMVNNPANSSIVIPQVVQRDQNGVNKPTNSSPKILIWGGIKPTSLSNNIQKWDFVQSFDGIKNINNTSTMTFEYYPYAGTCDSPLDPEWDINWFYTDYVYWNRARWTNRNLYNAYWRNFIEEITDPQSKVITCDVNLNANDISKLDFKKIYVISGNYLRLQSVIDYDPTTNKLTKCEFLKLKSPSKFKKKSVTIGGSYFGAVDNSRPISVSVNEVPPANFFDRKPVGNWSASDLTAQGDIKFTGQNNVVSSGTINIQITGSENYIGSGSKNININGDGVFVSGGVENVNVIGTNKIYIDESDVTYINGIRYKNGVAISRSNVIDAGQDVVLTKSSKNTVSNVIDAGEDVVIPSGSNTYEDVIDAGSDRILPDIPNFGISTWNSPNPTTNRVGGVWTDLGTQSLSEVIIERVNPVPYLDIK